MTREQKLPESKKVDLLFIGGGMANTFLASKSIDVGLSKVEEKYFNLIKNIENNALESGCRIILPTDVITSKSLGDKLSGAFSISLGSRKSIIA